MIKCLVIDDERFARELLEDNIRMIPFLDLVGVCKNTTEAMTVMAKEKVDLVFLDIQMPGLSGLQWLQAGIIQSPMVIMVTAYEQYALEGFNLNVVDYVVKPVPFDRFLKACSRALDLHRLKNNQAAEASLDQRYLFVNSDYALIRIDMDQVTHIEGLKDYIRIFQLNTEKPIVPRLSLHYMEEKLPATRFLRVHRSYIVALDKIISIKKNRLYLPDADIPFTYNHSGELMKYITERS
jgi:DNA-binding LytR/AlgR family response regulator